MKKSKEDRKNISVIPLGERVLIRPDEIPDETDIGGFVVLNKEAKWCVFGTVEAVDPSLEELKSGDRVAFSAYNADTFDDDRVLVEIGNVLAKIEE